ncbi:MULTISPECIES: dethiobiotin synthase [Vibrio]|uniref:dethiobiotin synthase n=1 Tax=Vibrio TaxID=662 RepID=UPI000B5C1F55|nr:MULTISPECIES: dethiobiotin synthase [Vibrio]HBV75389.1 dethiobiotin synthase [Vibrio sp.]
MINSVFITGTDTDVGKTVVSQAILIALTKQGVKTSGLKPVAAGCEITEQGMTNNDALYLQNASSVKLGYALVNPYTLELPASPHIAAEKERVNIDFNILSSVLFQHRQQAEFVVVEGAGGWRVPISKEDGLSSWVQQEQLPVVLVVGVKLGCLNHTMLTVETIQKDGLVIVGWVANMIDPDVKYYSEMIQLLEEKIPAPKLGEIPYLSEENLPLAYQCLDISLLF